VKVNTARTMSNVAVVWTAWLLESMALWKRLDEKRFLIAEDGSQGPSHQAEDRLGELSADTLSPGNETLEEIEVVDGDRTAEDINWDDADAELDAFLMESGPSLAAFSACTEAKQTTIRGRAHQTRNAAEVERRRRTTKRKTSRPRRHCSSASV
jgi:hypothetical protein